MAHRRVLRDLLRQGSALLVAPERKALESVRTAATYARHELRHTLAQGHEASQGKRQTEDVRGAWVFATAGAAAFYATFTRAHAATTAEAAEETKERAAGSSHPKLPSLDAPSKPRVVFVLGGPGSGKGTQCAKIVEEFGFVHLSAGDLLRAELKSGSANGNMIQQMIKEGKIVPAEVTVALLQAAMTDSPTKKFLIDGFPRNEENRTVFERDTGIEPEFILFFDCPEEVMEKRLLGRNEGRIDDNIETIRKRFHTFVESSVPVINYYDTKGKVQKVNATKSPDEVFEALAPLFMRFRQD